MLQTIPIAGVSCGLTICYDLRFPEVYRKLALAGAEMIVLCAAWPLIRQSHWETLIRARAIENQLYVIAANRTGTDGVMTFCGSSRIVDPYGVIVASAAENREEVIYGEINTEIVRTVREKIPVFEDRRTDLY